MFFCQSKRKSKALAPSIFIASIVCKPSSVLNGHLSRTHISARLKRYGERAGHVYAPNLASGGVYIAHCCQIAGELLPRLSILTANAAVFFCCTVLEVAFTGSYPAPLPYDARTFLEYFTRPPGYLAYQIKTQKRFFCNKISPIVYKKFIDVEKYKKHPRTVLRVFNRREKR